MEYKVLIDNKKITGSAEHILAFLNNQSFFTKCSSIHEFIKKIQQDVWRLYGIGIQITNDKTAPSQLIDQLLHFNLLQQQPSEDFK